MTKIKEFLSKYRLSLGITVSIGYAAFAIYILFPDLTYLFYFNLSELSKLGGYLSGVFSPLAFIWFLVNHFHQVKKHNLEKFNLDQPIFELIHIEICDEVPDEYKDLNLDDETTYIYISFKVHKNNISKLSFHPIDDKEIDNIIGGTIISTYEGKEYFINIPLVDVNFLPINIKEKTHFYIPMKFIDINSRPVTSSLHLIIQDESETPVLGEFQQTQKSWDI